MEKKFENFFIKFNLQSILEGSFNFWLQILLKILVGELVDPTI